VTARATRPLRPASRPTAALVPKAGVTADADLRKAARTRSQNSYGRHDMCPLAIVIVASCHVQTSFMMRSGAERANQAAVLLSQPPEVWTVDREEAEPTSGSRARRGYGSEWRCARAEVRRSRKPRASKGLMPTIGVTTCD
jgi:hypothetical protein